MLIVLHGQACNNAWANLRLLRACIQLGRDGFVAPRPSYFGSIAATANHTLTVDWFYVDAFERWVDHEPVNPNSLAVFDPACPHLDPTDLQRAQQDVDLRLVRALERLSPERLNDRVPLRRSHGVVEEHVLRYLGHLFQHQTHHRGQIHQLLSTTGVAPPQLDEFYCAGEAHLRAEELAVLGLDAWDRTT